MSESVTFHLDPRCPWCWQTSSWIRRLEDLDVLDVSWSVFCLEIANFAKPLEMFDVDRCVAAPSLRTLVAVRDAEGQPAAREFYAALGDRYFDREERLDDEATITASLADAGLDTSWFQKASSDASTWDTVITEHERLVADTRSFGVPTIRLDGGQGPAIFGPVISNPVETDDEAIELWGNVSWLTRYENFSELKRDRSIDPDLAYWRTVMARRADQTEATR